MYSKTSVELKKDFYCRYGKTTGHLWFEWVGYPCVLMQSKTHMLAFSLDCGVRAYGRAYGDVLRITDADSNICDVKFVNNGLGAQILYKADQCGILQKNEVIAYAIEKTLNRMNPETVKKSANSLVNICDAFGNKGWCAYTAFDRTESVPLPLSDVNVLLIKTRKSKRMENELLSRFYEGETGRITAAAMGLKQCRTDILFEMLNESEKAIELLLNPSQQSVFAVHTALAVDGVCAARICESGVMCFVKKERTDSAIRAISSEYEYSIGYNAGFYVVK